MSRIFVDVEIAIVGPADGLVFAVGTKFYIDIVEV